jgi:serine phosphatase RsbU (regulator of sigma subunit)
MCAMSDGTFAEAADVGAPDASSAGPLKGRFRLPRLLAGPIKREARRLGERLEAEVLSGYRYDGHDVVSFEVDPAGEVRLMDSERDEAQVITGRFRRVCELLSRVGISRLEFDPRLEWGQIYDVLMMVYDRRRRLAARDGSADSPWVARLTCEEGVQLACTNTRLHGQTLRVVYSYCQTRFSRVVQWYERRHSHFADHRALFQAAPFYALAPAAVTVGIFIVYALSGGFWLLLGLTAVGAAALSAMVYLFFMVVGSVEYDNEEKAFRLRQANSDLRRYAERTGNDLAEARNVQRKLLPDHATMPLPGRLEWARSFVPETEVGGDYFDVAAIGDGQVAILFTDVCGHGMAAALITAILKTTFKGWAEKPGDLIGFVRKANRNLCEFTPTGSFAAMIVAVYDPAARRLSYVNCGHAPMPVRIPADPAQPVAYLRELGAMILGVLEEIEISVAEQSLAPGDKVVLATDGLTEAMTPKRRMYGCDRMSDLLTANRHEPLQTVVDRLVEDVDRFSAGAEQTDDRTVLAFLTR